MHRPEVVAEALRLREEEGLGARRAAKRLGVSVGTVRDWYAGKLPRHSKRVDGSAPDGCGACGHRAHQLEALPKEYAHLLGLYLGDGCISTHPRGVFRLRITLDKKYPGIIEECCAAMSAVMPASKVTRLLKPSNDVEVSSYSKSWPCLFPQHGAGTKHSRRISLADWQQLLAEKWPDSLLRGMIQSDGHRFINTGRGNWRHPRYGFTNMSTDITSIFCTACDKLGLRWTGAFPADEKRAVTVYVSRKADVARMDKFIGPKR